MKKASLILVLLCFTWYCRAQSHKIPIITLKPRVQDTLTLEGKLYPRQDTFRLKKECSDLLKIQTSPGQENFYYTKTGWINMIVTCGVEDIHIHYFELTKQDYVRQYKIELAKKGDDVFGSETLEIRNQKRFDELMDKVIKIMKRPRK